MMIGRTRLDNKSLIYGAGAMLALCVLPKVSDFTSSVVTKIRNMIGGKK